MAMTKNGGKDPADEMLASREVMWSAFIRWSTWVIVLVAILLIGMALFLL